MKRYEPCSYQTLSGDFLALMFRDDNGSYITYESHMQEVEPLQARLKALECESERDRNVVVCLSGDGYNFITGAEYFYEIGSFGPGKDPEVIHICSDAFESDMQGLRRWKANKVSVGNEPAKYEVKQLSTCGIFRIK